MNVREKHKAKQAAKHAISKPDSKDSSSAESGSSEFENGSEEILELARRAPTPVFSLAPSIGERATAYFVTNYVINTSGPTTGYMDQLSTICNIHGGEDAGLLEAMKAVGIAGVAHSAREPSLLNSARWHYVKAIQATNDALKSPLLVKRDNTLTAIMILSIFETVTGSNHKSIHDWAEHVRGAAALLKLRGREQLETSRGRRMFVQIASTLMISCLQRDSPLPDFIVEWTEEMRLQGFHYGPAFTSQHTMMVFTQFRASLHDGSISEPNEILAQALNIDEILVRLYSEDLPPDWEYETIYTDQNKDCVWNGQYHVYYDYCKYL